MKRSEGIRTIATVVAFTADESIISEMKADIVLHPQKDQDVVLTNETIVMNAENKEVAPASYEPYQVERPSTSVIGI